MKISHKSTCMVVPFFKPYFNILFFEMQGSWCHRFRILSGPSDKRAWRIAWRAVDLFFSSVLHRWLTYGYKLGSPLLRVKPEKSPKDLAEAYYRWDFRSLCLFFLNSDWFYLSKGALRPPSASKFRGKKTLSSGIHFSIILAICKFCLYFLQRAACRE